MSSRFKLIISSIVLSVIIVFIFLSFRIEKLENDYSEYLSRANRTIVSLITKKSTTEKKKKRDLQKTFNAIVQKYPRLALLAIADSAYAVQQSVKNDQFIPTSALYDAIITDFSENQLKIQSSKGFTNRYYELEQEKVKKQVRFLIFITHTKKNKYLALFPFKPGKKFITKVILEVVLLVVLCIIATTLIYLYIEKRSRREAQPFSANQFSNKQRNTTQTPTDGVVKKRELNKTRQEEQKKSHKQQLRQKDLNRERAVSRANLPKDQTTEELDDQTFALFQTIFDIQETQTISLYLKNEESYIKRYDLQSQSFLKYSGESPESVDIDSAVGQELKLLRTLITRNNTRLVLPLAHRKELLGIIVVQSLDQLTSHTVASIKNHAGKFVRNLRHFYLNQDDTIDAETGLPNRYQYHAHFADLAKRYTDYNENFSVIFISLVTDPGDIQGASFKNTVSILHNTIEETIPENTLVAIFDPYLAFLLPGSESPQAKGCAEDLIRALKHFRIKTTMGSTFTLSPRAGYASTDLIDSVEELTETALANLRTAITM